MVDISIKTLGIDWDMVDGVIEGMDKLRADNRDRLELQAEVGRLRETIDPLEAANRHLQAVRDECERQFQEKVARVNELDAEVERLKQLVKGHDYQLETERRMGVRQQEMIERLRAVLFKIADDSAHADQYVRWAQEALGR